jgi:hypothetical protein
MKKLLVGLFLIHVSSLAHAGWVSSGGESLLFEKNPWFVKNTSTVNYCIQMDAPSFSITQPAVEKLIQEAFDFWKKEFSANGSGRANQPGYAQIATQNFILKSECDSVPLIFKFGLKNLDSEERHHLVDPKKFIGVTIRKEYSLETLQASGIIYITADKGADAYTNNGMLISEAWKHPALLRYALIHELGHMFGLPHEGSGIMSEVFMSVLLNSRLVNEFENLAQMNVLNPQNYFEVCRDSGGMFNPDFFGAAKSARCLKFEAIKNANLQWAVSVKETEQGEYKTLGTVQADSLDQSPYALKPAVIVQLPDEQKVFSATETILGPFLVGAVFSDTSYNGTFHPLNSVRALPIQMTLSAEKISFVGLVNNQNGTVLNYSPVSFMKAIFP